VELVELVENSPLITFEYLITFLGEFSTNPQIHMLRVVVGNAYGRDPLAGGIP